MWKIERLSSKHDRSAFDCGQPALNDWLKQRARQWDQKDLARTYVLVPHGTQSVVGYYCLSGHHVRYEALPADQSKGIPTIDIPVVLIGRLAVSQNNRGQGLGGRLVGRRPAANLQAR